VQSTTKTPHALPTEEAYGELQRAFNHFNARLFDGSLPTCLFTLQREKRTYGYFSSERFVNGTGQKTDEIAINPAYFAVVPLLEIMQTLVHEMAHLWQFHFGKPGRRGYHNLEWAQKMEQIGLMPSSTGKPGGKRVGEKMADYAIEGGPFMQATTELFDSDFAITWMDRYPVRTCLEQVAAGSVAGIALDNIEAIGITVSLTEIPESKSNRRKYSCPQCGANAWGKPELSLICGNCMVPLADVGT
jgi:predicted SprT family Zn-dependent metalloprotease